MRAQPAADLADRIARNRAIDSLRRAHAAAAGGAHGKDDERRPVDEGPADDGPGPLDLLQRASDARSKISIGESPKYFIGIGIYSDGVKVQVQDSSFFYM